ncbi:hypothetical protein PIB30_038560 [Stylosanthes scabra]|uniref:Uncharacterized protein n=1 Tax=Stylosanthes scabra TaxID=79078 RepID=A0ABU6YBD7_9FABA|nr:hypothetical protein [Stylosanthes scabra]
MDASLKFSGVDELEANDLLVETPMNHSVPFAPAEMTKSPLVMAGTPIPDGGPTLECAAYMGMRLFERCKRGAVGLAPPKRSRGASSSRGHGRQFETLIPERMIDKSIVDMVAMQNSYSLQHRVHPNFWGLPSRFVVRCRGVRRSNRIGYEIRNFSLRI